VRSPEHRKSSSTKDDVIEPQLVLLALLALLALLPDALTIRWLLSPLACKPGFTP